MASYRIVSQADATFAVETRIPKHDPCFLASFKTEAVARKYIERQTASKRFRQVGTQSAAQNSEGD
jgi:hypothetical protein